MVERFSKKRQNLNDIYFKTESSAEIFYFLEGKNIIKRNRVEHQHFIFYCILKQNERQFPRQVANDFDGYETHN